jgi:hypothetical protein
MEHDIPTLQNQISGLEEKKSLLQAEEKAFIKVQGIDEQIEKSRTEMSELEVDTQALKEEISELKAQKRSALASTMNSLAGKMSEVMPEGRAVFDIGDDGSVSIGLENNGIIIPHAGLSGGQKTAFDSALSYAMLGDGEKLIIVEAAEIDYQRLLAMLKSIEENADDKTQYIVNTWAKPKAGSLGKKWRVVEL